jgi:hypothetical protein
LFFSSLGQSGSGPAILSSRPDLAQIKKESFLGRDRPNPFWAEFGPTLLGLRLAQLVGRPSPHNILYYLLYCFILFIYIYMDIYQKKLKKYSEKSLKNIVDFPAYFYQNCLILVCIFIP